MGEVAIWGGGINSATLNMPSPGCSIGKMSDAQRPIRVLEEDQGQPGPVKLRRCPDCHLLPHGAGEVRCRSFENCCARIGKRTHTTKL